MRWTLKHLREKSKTHHHVAQEDQGINCMGKQLTCWLTTRVMWANVTTEQVLVFIKPRALEDKDDVISVQSVQTSSVTQVNSVDAFKKGIKKNKSDCPDLTNDHKWETFKQKLLVTARS